MHTGIFFSSLFLASSNLLGAIGFTIVYVSDSGATHPLSEPYSADGAATSMHADIGEYKII